MKVLISDKLAQEGVEILKQAGLEVDCRFGIPPEELKEIIKDYEGLIVRSGTRVTAEIIAEADRLKVIGRAGVGLDNVDLAAATKKGIVAMNTPAGNTTSTAEHTMSLILALSRNIPQACASLKAGRWERSKFSGVELHGKTIGIIGLGRIGSTVAAMAKAFGMSVLAVDPYLSLEVAAQKGVEMVDLPELLRRSDYITVHIPKSSETRHLISDKEFAVMKPGVRVINCARGGIIDEQALVRALEEGRIAGCALDVFEQEPPPPDSPLLTRFDNCIVTPHLGASTSEAQINVAIEIAEAVRDALLGRGIVNAANFPSLSSEAYQILAPYMDLARRMGLFAGQLVAGRMTALKITYHGVMTQYKTAPMTMTLLHGLLQPILGDTVNAVNAMDVARERGIDVREVVSTREEEFVNLVIAELETDRESFRLWGTLTGNNQPRIVKINGVYVEASPQGVILFINNNDRPGIVGAVGTLLAHAGVNIAGITFGRDRPGGRAVSVVNLDSGISEDLLAEIARTPDILLVKLIRI